MDIPDSSVLKWGGGYDRCINVTEELINWSIPIAERMHKLAMPEWISRYREVTKSTLQLRVDNEDKKREMQEKIDELTAQLDKEEEQSERRDAQLMLEEMDALLCE